MHGALASELTARSIERLRYDTPYFLISRRTLLEKLGEFHRLFPGAAIHYALKANSEPEVLRLLANAGACFEAASRYELDLLKAIGVSPDRIIFGTSVKCASHIAYFHQHGVDRFALDSGSELEKIAGAAPGSRVYVRIAVNDAGSVFKFSEKFGTDSKHAVALLWQAQALGLEAYGLSFHVGSQAHNTSAWTSALFDVREVMCELQQVGIRIEVLNIGGGFPCQYASSEIVPSLAEITDCLNPHLDALPYKPKLILEPGRGLVAGAAVLVASVIGRVPRGEHTWLFLDAGVYNGLFEAMAYQGSTRYPIDSVRLSNASDEALFALAGPTGDAPDIITREVLLPRDTDVGDRLIIRNTGAYSLSVTSTFNGFPKPPLYIV
jgi:ornithine decarboxylase